MPISLHDRLTEFRAELIATLERDGISAGVLALLADAEIALQALLAHESAEGVPSTGKSVPPTPAPSPRAG